MSHLRASVLVFITLAVYALPLAEAEAQDYNLNSLEAMGDFLNGVFPSSTPGSNGAGTSRPHCQRHPHSQV